MQAVKKLMCIVFVLSTIIFGGSLFANTRPTHLPIVAGDVGTVVGTGLHGADDGSYATFNLPSSIFAGSDGYLYVADTFNNKIRRVSPNSYANTIAGNMVGKDAFGLPAGLYLDGEIDYALFNRPGAVAVDDNGRIFVADTENHVIRLIENGTVYTFSGSGLSGHRGGPPLSARFSYPTAITFDNRGNLYVADTGNHSIRRVCGRSGRVVTVAGYPHRVGYSNGGVTLAGFNSPMGIALSDDGERIYVADTGNNVIRVIQNRTVSTKAGVISGFDEDNYALGGFEDGYEAMFNMPMGLALYEGVLLVADYANHSIRGVLSDGLTFTVAGTGYAGFVNGTPETAQFHFPMGVSVMGDTVYVADSGNNLVRRIEITANGEHP